jgi:hypothetical protein
MAVSEGLFSPRISPDHTRLAALRASNGELLVYAFATREWRAIGPPGS